jgi:hypothetical protein
MRTQCPYHPPQLAGSIPLVLQEPFDRVVPTGVPHVPADELPATPRACPQLSSSTHEMSIALGCWSCPAGSAPGRNRTYDSRFRNPVSRRWATTWETFLLLDALEVPRSTSTRWWPQTGPQLSRDLRRILEGVDGSPSTMSRRNWVNSSRKTAPRDARVFANVPWVVWSLRAPDSHHTSGALDEA